MPADIPNLGRAESVNVSANQCKVKMMAEETARLDAFSTARGEGRIVD